MASEAEYIEEQWHINVVHFTHERQLIMVAKKICQRTKKNWLITFLGFHHIKSDVK